MLQGLNGDGFVSSLPCQFSKHKSIALTVQFTRDRQMNGGNFGRRCNPCQFTLLIFFLYSLRN